MQNKKLKVASLFCGCGGSDLGMIGGFEYLGTWYDKLPFDIVYAVDFDHWAVETYNKNFEHKAVCADVTEVNFADVPDVDVMIGGFPCQSFSTVNPTKDTNDERANLYKQIVRFLLTKKPKYFICENVKGLITLKGGSIIKKIVDEFKDCGYHVQFKLLKAVEFGIPQRRERVIIIGIREDIAYNYEYPMPVCNETQEVPLGKVIDKLDIEETKYYFSERAVQGVKNAKNNMKRGLWQDLSKPCLTVTAHLAKTSMNSRDPILLVNAEKELYRRFTPREAARIQSFPDDFRLNQSEPKSYKQIGNAVPPVLMWYVSNQLGKAICGSSSRPTSTSEPNYKDKCHTTPKYIQLNFWDMLKFYPDLNRDSMTAKEDENIPYGKNVHGFNRFDENRIIANKLIKLANERLYICNGNIFDYKALNANGIVVFVKEGFNQISYDHGQFEQNTHQDVKVETIKYESSITESDLEHKLIKSLDTIADAGCTQIIVSSADIKDKKNIEKDVTIIEFLDKWLYSDKANKVKKITLVDKNNFNMS